MKKALTLLLALALVLGAIPCGASAEGTETVKLSAVLTAYGRYKTAIDDLIAKFAAVQLEKRGINVVIDVEYPQEKEVLSSRLAGGTPPDIFNMHIALDAPLFDKGGYLPDLSNEEFVGKVFESVSNMTLLNGKIVGAPLETFVWNCLYNKTYFEECGLEFPNTISELKNVIEVFKSKGIAPFSTPFQDPDQFASWTSQVPMCAIAAQLVPDFYEQMEAGTGSFQMLVDNGWLDVVDLILENGTERALNTTKDDGLTNFANGDGAILMTGPWYSEQILAANPDFKLGLGALPIDENPENAVVMMAVSTVITCSPESENYEIAKDFAAFVLDDAVTNDFFNACQFNQLATNQNVDMFPWTADGVKYMEANRVYAEYGMPGSVYEEIGRGLQMYLDKQIDRNGYVEMLDQAYANGLKAIQ